MNVFLAFRTSPYPQAMVVISSPSPLTYVDPESDESMAELMQHALAMGMRPLAPPVLNGYSTGQGVIVGPELRLQDGHDRTGSC